jgi:effector-binding domain-containing protein
MAYTVQLQQVPQRPLAVVRRRAARQELAKVVPEACGAVWNVVRAQKLQGAGRHVAVYLDDVINLEVGVELDSPFEGSGEVVPSATPAGEVATVAHFGPYGGLAAAHDAIHQWCRNNHRTLGGPSWEVYGHWLPEWNQDPSKIRTDVYYLLKPVGQ